MTRRVDVLDARAGEGAVGEDANLVPEQRDRLAALRLDGQRHQRHADLLAGRRDHIELALVGPLGDLLGEAQQPVRLARHGRDDHHHAMAFALRREGTARDRPDAFDRADRGAAVLLNDQQGGTF